MYMGRAIEILVYTLYNYYVQYCFIKVYQKLRVKLFIISGRKVVELAN